MLIKFQVQTYIKNAGGNSLKWKNDMKILQLYATRFQQVLQNHLLKMLIHLLIHLRQQMLQHQLNNNFHARQQEENLRVDKLFSKTSGW